MNLSQIKPRFAVVLFVAVVALAGCHKKAVPPPPPAPPPPPPAPTASITANPSAFQQGQSSTLSWTTTNAAKVTITGLGAVADHGSSSVSPTRSTDYTITATAASGASVQATTRVTVLPAPVTPPTPGTPASITEEELFAQNVHDIFFDYDSYAVRSDAASTISQDVSFLEGHPGMKIVIEGHCDDRGSEEYNLALGQNRAQAMKQALVNGGLEASRIRLISYGSEKPFCSEENDACWQKNRRDHVKLDR